MFLRSTREDVLPRNLHVRPCGRPSPRRLLNCWRPMSSRWPRSTLCPPLARWRYVSSALDAWYWPQGETYRCSVQAFSCWIPARRQRGAPPHPSQGAKLPVWRGNCDNSPLPQARRGPAHIYSRGQRPTPQHSAARTALCVPKDIRTHTRAPQSQALLLSFYLRRRRGLLCARPSGQYNEGQHDLQACLLARHAWFQTFNPDFALSCLTRCTVSHSTERGVDIAISFFKFLS